MVWSFGQELAAGGFEALSFGQHGNRIFWSVRVGLFILHSRIGRCEYLPAKFTQHTSFGLKSGFFTVQLRR